MCRLSRESIFRSSPLLVFLFHCAKRKSRNLDGWRAKAAGLRFNPRIYISPFFSFQLFSKFVIFLHVSSLFFSPFPLAPLGPLFFTLFPSLSCTVFFVVFPHFIFLFFSRLLCSPLVRGPRSLNSSLATNYFLMNIY